MLCHSSNLPNTPIDHRFRSLLLLASTQFFKYSSHSRSEVLLSSHPHTHSNLSPCANTKCAHRHTLTWLYSWLTVCISIGDFYRGCGVCLFFFCSAFTDATPHKLLKMPLLTVLPLQHFHGRYFTGETLDCGSDSCKTSRAHKHKANNCGCAEVCNGLPFVRWQYPWHRCLDCGWGPTRPEYVPNTIPRMPADDALNFLLRAFSFLGQGF